MENNNTLSEFLKRTACERQLSLRDLANILGISHAYVLKLMAGVDSRNNKSISPSIDMLIRACSHYAKCTSLRLILRHSSSFTPCVPVRYAASFLPRMAQNQAHKYAHLVVATRPSQQ